MDREGIGKDKGEQEKGEIRDNKTEIRILYNSSSQSRDFSNNKIDLTR